MDGSSIGVVGLGPMGRNLVLNIADKGFAVSGWDAWPEPVARLAAEAHANVRALADLPAFVASLARPRRILMLVKAGDVVDQTIAKLRPMLSPGDVLIDGGNEQFRSTERRAAELGPAGIRYFGMGVSGGESGARHGPSLMPGGDREGYELLAPVLAKIAAQHPDGPCVTHVGPGGAGHYVKMVHNGIEYGDMQLIAEAYDVLRTLGGLSNAELADVFDEWNRGELQSYLVEITAAIFRKKDPEGPGELVDAILDTAGMKGTGKWTVQDAADLGAPIPTIASSVEARLLSARKDDRVVASRSVPGPDPAAHRAPSKEALVADVRASLYAAKVCSYAQGMNLLRLASAERGWELRLGELARIWQAGCIIRAAFLGRIKAAYDRDPALASLVLDPSFQAELAPRQEGWRRVVALAATSGLPVLSTAASLGWYDMARRARLPANLTQAQRDFFGAHTYQRVDREGTFHTQWE